MLAIKNLKHLTFELITVTIDKIRHIKISYESWLFEQIKGNKLDANWIRQKMLIVQFKKQQRISITTREHTERGTVDTYGDTKQ